MSNTQIPSNTRIPSGMVQAPVQQDTMPPVGSEEVTSAPIAPTPTDTPTDLYAPPDRYPEGMVVFDNWTPPQAPHAPEADVGMVSLSVVCWAVEQYLTVRTVLNSKNST